MKRNHRSRGFTLVEMMVGMVIGLIILAGAVYVFMGNAESNIYQMRSTRFVQQLRDVMDRMVTDVRRAGYLGYKHYAVTGTIQLANPFDYDTFSNGTVSFEPDPTVLSMSIHTTVDINDAVIDHGGNIETPASSCITYAYNLDDDDEPALVDNLDANELFGFQLRVDTTTNIGSIYMRTGGGSASFGCDVGTWEQVTDTNVVDVDTLTFAVANTECLNATDSSRSDCYGTTTPGTTADDAEPDDLLVIVREVRISMTGKSVDDNALTFTLDQVIDLPNDRAIKVRTP